MQTKCPDPLVGRNGQRPRCRGLLPGPGHRGKHTRLAPGLCRSKVEANKQRKATASPWAQPSRSVARPGLEFAFSTRGARMSADGGAVQRDEDELISLPTSLLSDRRGAATRSACTSISSLDI